MMIPMFTAKTNRMKKAKRNKVLRGNLTVGILVRTEEI